MLQPEDIAGISTHPSEDIISGVGKVEKKDNSHEYFFTQKDLRKYLIERLSINVVPTNAFWESGYKYSSKDKVEFYTGDLLRVQIVPSRGPKYWIETVIVQGDGGFYYQRYKITREGLVLLKTKTHLTSKKSKEFKLELSYLRDIKN